MAEADAELQSLLPQGADRAFHRLRNLRYRRPRLRMLLEQLDVRCGVRLARRQLLLRFCQFELLQLARQHST